MDGFEVDPEALRVAGATISPIGAELTAAAQATAGPVQSAQATNPGFFVSEALGYAYAQIDRAVRTAATDIRQYGENLSTVADRYSEVDGTEAGAFRDITGSLG